MISRLLELEFGGFRCYEKPQLLPLDADVVVLFGANGSGKTSIFSAIEYAVTGAVPHLAAYSDDYPRSLQNVYSQTGYVALKFEEGGSATRQLRRAINKPAEGVAITSEDSRFFQDRCYLSQSQLSRLFEVYENASRKDADQPLVRFARELLGLDPLENLTEGLHVVGDTRRLDSALEPYRKMKMQREELKSKIIELSRQQASLKDVFDQAISNLEKLLPGGSSPGDNIYWTIETLKARREAIELELLDKRYELQLQSLQRQQGTLEGALRFLLEARSPKVGPRERIVQRRDELAGQLEQASQSFSHPIKRLRELLHDADSNFVPIEDASDPLTTLDAYEERAKRFLSILQADRESMADISSRLSQSISRQVMLQEGLGGPGATTANDTSRLQTLNELLVASLHHIHGDDCPVCQRDFSELKSGSLRSRVEGVVQELGGDIARLKEESLRAATLQAELFSLTTEIAALQNQLDQRSARVADLTTYEAAINEVLNADLPNAQSARGTFAELSKRYREASELVIDTERRIAQEVEMLKLVSEISGELQIPHDTEPMRWVETLLQDIRMRIQELVNLGTRNSALVSALRAGEREGMELARVAHDLHSSTESLDKLNQKLDQVDASIREARALSSAATEAKRSLLENVFDKSVNGLWRDLFRRLVKSDRFTPQLKLERQGRQLRIRVEGHGSGVKPFDYAASVLSSGNFNTAALSLFLSVHLLESTRHKLIVLDDPVQNMDDIHVVQLAGLLRTIVFEESRQLIIGVHEKALFEYLCLELGPTKTNQSLLAVELSSTDSVATSIKVDRRTWLGDKLQLGV